MKKILIVDDDPDIVDLVKNRLEANHYEVISADDGNKGIKQAQEQMPDLIIVDVLMPQMPGGDVVRFLKTDVKTKHIPVIFLTAIAVDIPQEADAKGINVGGRFYPAIAKPFDPAKLLFEIKRLIGD